jgi:DsbC/DsbD-like thiol-disulfide interchange protein
MLRRALLALTMIGTAFSQEPSPKNVVKLDAIETVKAKQGGTIKVALPVRVDEGFHVNSNKPADPYLIPLRLTWAAGPLENSSVVFPKPQLENYGFSDKPVSVFTGTFEIVTSFKVARNAVPGHSEITGKLHYQACNDKTCLTPKTIEVTLPLDIER